MEQPRQHRSGFKRRLYALLGLLAIVGAVLGGLSLAGLLGNQGGGEGILAAELFEPPQPVGITGLDAGVAKGKLAPDFAVSDFSGTRFRLSDFRGKAVVVNFWATWCLFCALEMPTFTSSS